MTDQIESLMAEIAQPSPKFGKHVHGMLNGLREAPYDREDVLQFMAFAMGMAKAMN